VAPGARERIRVRGGGASGNEETDRGCDLRRGLIGRGLLEPLGAPRTSLGLLCPGLCGDAAGMVAAEPGSLGCASVDSCTL